MREARMEFNCSEQRKLMVRGTDVQARFDSLKKTVERLCLLKTQP
jgi:hypothetical protein